jgi:archaellum component FlaC
MAYNKINWDETTTPLSAENLNHMETQYEEAVNESNRNLNEHNKSNGVHGLTENQYLVKTKNANQYPDWSEIQNKPQIPSGQAIQNLQNEVNSLENEVNNLESTVNNLESTVNGLGNTVSNLENRVSNLEQGGSGGNGGGGGLTEQEVQNIAANVKASSQYAVVIRRNPINPMEGEIYWVD